MNHHIPLDNGYEPIMSQPIVRNIVPRPLGDCEKKAYPTLMIISDRLSELEKTYTMNVRFSDDFNVVIYVGQEEIHELYSHPDVSVERKEDGSPGRFKLFGLEVLAVNLKNYLSVDLRLKNVNKNYKLDLLNQL